MKDIRVIDRITGEFRDLNGDFVIIHKNSLNANQEKLHKIMHRKKDKRGRFVQLVHDKTNIVENKLSLSECNVILQLLFCTHKDTKNQIVQEKDGHLKPMSVSDIAQFLEKSKRQVVRDLKKFEQLHLLLVDKCSRQFAYSFNPNFFTFTKKQNKLFFTKLFLNKLTEVKNKLHNNEYGALLKFMQYFHYQTYYLVENSNYDVRIDPEKSIAENMLLEQNDNKLEHLNQRRIAEVLGITKQATIKFMRSFEKAGAIKVEKQNGVCRFLIHPDLMFRLDENGQDDYTNTIRVQFNQFKEK